MSGLDFTAKPGPELCSRLLGPAGKEHGALPGADKVLPGMGKRETPAQHKGNLLLLQNCWAGPRTQQRPLTHRSCPGPSCRCSSERGEWGWDAACGAGPRLGREEGQELVCRVPLCHPCQLSWPGRCHPPPACFGQPRPCRAPMGLSLAPNTCVGRRGHFTPSPATRHQSYHLI